MNKYHHLKQLRIDDILHEEEFGSLVSKWPDQEDLLNALFEITTRVNVWVTDDEAEGHSIYVFDTKGANKDKFLAVHNQSGTILYLWHIDGVMFSRFSKCDCAIINDKILHLVEFKSEAENRTTDAIRANYKKAYTQLKLTYEKFLSLYKSIDCDLFDIYDDIDATIVFNKTVPQDSAYKKSLQSEFADETNLVLSFTNELSI